MSKIQTPKLKKEPMQVPKGMHDLIGKDFYAYQGFFEKAAEVAIYYGFKPIETPILEHADVFVKGTGEGTDIVEKEMYTLKTKGGDNLALRPEGTPAVMRAYLEHGMHSWPQPVMFYYGGSFFRHEKPQHGRYRELKQFGLEIMGTEKSIADSMIIRIASLILEEAGMKNMTIEINSIGDKNCKHIYRKALIAYYKKNLSDVCADCKRRFKDNPLRLLDCKEPKCQEIKKGAPETVSYLCDACKTHFKEVLESLETMGVEYKINSNLVRGLDYYSRTVFEITAPDIPKVASTEPNPSTSSGQGEPRRHALCGGGRYDYLAKQMGSKKDVPAVGVGIGVDRVIESSEAIDLSPRILKKPKIFFIQLGFEAKQMSMTVIEILRKARVPISQSLSKDSLSAQLATSERLQIPYSIILGQREVLDETVIIRNMENRSQDTVKIAKLGEYLKTHLK
jgi:histidyl-tRNA synthetase